MYNVQLFLCAVELLFVSRNKTCHVSFRDEKVKQRKK